MTMGGNELQLLLSARDEVSDVMREVSGATAETKSSMDKLKGALVPVGVAMTAVGVAGLKMVGDARKMNAQLGQTALTLGVSTKEMRDLALETTNVTFPLQSVTETFELLARAGVRNTDEMMAVATAFDTLGDATGNSAEAMAELLLPAFKLFGEDLPTTAKELDRFTFLTKTTTVDLQDFGTMLTRMAPEMDTLGLSMDDAVLTLAALSEKGIEGSAATLALRTAITEAAREGKSLNEVMGISQEEINALAVEMEGATGATQAYADIANTQFGIMDKVKQRFSELTLQAGSFLTPMEPMLAGMTAMGPALIFMGSSMGTATVKALAHTAAMVAQKVAMLASTVVMGAVTAAQWLWNVAMTANPIGLVILAITGLIAAIALIVVNWDTVREKTLEVWRVLSDFLRGVFSNIVTFIKENWDKILAILFPAIGLPILIARNWGAIVDTVKDIFGRVTEVVLAVWDGIIESVKATFTGMINTVIGAINSLFGLVRDLEFTIGGWKVGVGPLAVTLPKITIHPFDFLPNLPSIPVMDTGGVVQGPGLFAVGPGVREIVRDPSGPMMVQVFLDGRMIGTGIGKLARDDEQVRAF